MKSSIFFKMLDGMLQEGKLSKEELEKMFTMISKELGASEHFKWCVEWDLKKFVADELEKLGDLAIPYETQLVKENITLDSGIEMMWNLVGGITGTNIQAFSNDSARIFVGSSSTAESATQTGVVTSLGNAPMDTGFPQVQSRSIIFQGTFGSDDANGDWREACVYNGNGANSVALNRKVENMGTKASGTAWTMKITISAITG